MPLRRHTPRLASHLGLDGIAAAAPARAGGLRSVTAAAAVPRVRAADGAEPQAGSADGGDAAAAEAFGESLLAGLTGPDGGLVSGLRQATVEVLKVRCCLCMHGCIACACIDARS